MNWWDGRWTSLAWLPKVPETDKSVVLHETIPGGRKEKPCPQTTSAVSPVQSSLAGKETEYLWGLSHPRLSVVLLVHRPPTPELSIFQNWLAHRSLPACLGLFRCTDPFPLILSGSSQPLLLPPDDS